MAMVMLVGCSTLSIGHIQILKTESLCIGWRWWWPSWHGTTGVRVTLHLPRVPGAVPVITARQVCLQSGESTTVIKTSSCCLRKVLTECRDDVKHFYCNVIKLGWILQQLAAVVCLDLLWIFTEHEWELHGGCCRQSVCFVLQPLVRIHGRLCKQYKMLPKSPLPQNQDNWCWNKLSPKRQWHRVAVAAVHFIRIIV